MRGGPPRTPTAGEGKGPSARTMIAAAPPPGARRTDRTAVPDAPGLGVRETVPGAGGDAGIAGGRAVGAAVTGGAADPRRRFGGVACARVCGVATCGEGGAD